MHLRTNTRTRTARAAVATTALAAAGLALIITAPAQAAPAAEARTAAAPAFLTADELPPHWGSNWTAHPVTRGLPDPEPFCAEGVLPRAGAAHRLFTTDYETNATQVVVKARTAAAAAELAAAVEESIRGCAARVEQQYPEATTSWQDYGPLDVEEGAHVYGVETSFPESARDVHLFGVGRDGRTVTLVRWGEMGTLGQAPVPAFQETTTTAVNKLYG